MLIFLMSLHMSLINSYVLVYRTLWWAGKTNWRLAVWMFYFFCIGRGYVRTLVLCFVVILAQIMRFQPPINLLKFQYFPLACIQRDICTYLLFWKFCSWLMKLNCRFLLAILPYIFDNIENDTLNWNSFIWYDN